MPIYIYYDIVYDESDSFILEVAGANTPISDVLFDPVMFVVEVTGINGSITDIMYDPSMTYEIPNVLITDFAFL